MKERNAFPHDNKEMARHTKRTHGEPEHVVNLSTTIRVHREPMTHSEAASTASHGFHSHIINP